MSRENLLWGTPRIQSVLALLGYIVAKATIDKYKVRTNKPPSQNWRTFLDNHLTDIVAIDFLTVPTATFRILFVFVVLRHDRRTVAHFNVTANPRAQWTARQMIEAFPYGKAPRFLIRDRDRICSSIFRDRIANIGIEEIATAPRSPWQNPYVERIHGSIRRECLNHIIVLSKRHLKRILRSYFEYYYEPRTHLSLHCNSPVQREVEPPCNGRVIAIPQIGGLHHRYRRAA
jgi:putative transposase